MATIENAGLSKEHLNLAYFSDVEELRAILKDLKIEVGEDGRLLLSEEQEVACSSCERGLTVEDVGHILPGSTLIYCRDPTCILDYYERFF